MRRVGFFLPLYKPFGMTSNRAVQIVKRALKRRSDEFGAKLKVGHAGTLDPRATGVLTIAVGRATRFIRFLRTEKHYTATFRLGVETDSDDLEGVVTRECAAPWVTRSRCGDVLTGFIGEQGQVPPIFSAIRLDGARAYALARSGRSDASEAEALREAGVMPDVLLVLEVPDEELTARCVDRRLDPVSGKIYHLKTDPPPADEEVV
jgi:tRNA pseudouridine55 synthase